MFLAYLVTLNTKSRQTVFLICEGSYSARINSPRRKVRLELILPLIRVVSTGQGFEELVSWMQNILQELMSRVTKRGTRNEVGEGVLRVMKVKDGVADDDGGDGDDGDDHGDGDDDGDEVMRSLITGTLATLPLTDRQEMCANHSYVRARAYFAFSEL